MNVFRLFLYCLAGILTLTFFSFQPLAAEDDDPLVIRLATESALARLYLLPITSDQTNLTSGYIKQLEQILAFDLNHNGSTYVAKNTSECDAIGQTGSFEQLGSIESWRACHIFHVVKVQVQGNAIAAAVLSVDMKSLKRIDPLPLTGDPVQDKKQIHRLADMIHKAFFGTDGIASTRILYTLTTKPSTDSRKWIAEVWESDYDGSNRRQLTKEGAMCVTPTYLPAKPGYTTGAFLYVSYKLGQPKIQIASLKDGSTQRLTYLRGNQLMPAVSQQRDKIAFISDVTGNPDLFLQPFSPEGGPEGKPQQIFAAKQATQGSPTFSPDGKRLAFVSNKDGSPKIYAINIPSPNTNLRDIKATLISKSNHENSAPAWSPDGTKIAYCARNKGDRQIWIYDFKTNQEMQLTQGPGNKENPSWAPNSHHLVYNTSDNDKAELFLINLNTPEPVQISYGPGEKRFPSWEPRIK